MQLEYLAFTAGVLTFFSPCALAMFPSYIAYLLKGKKSLKQGAVAGFLVGMGGSLVFILAGALSGPLIDYLLALNPLIKTFLGILLLVLGFIMLLRLEFRIPLPLPSITPRGSFYLFSLIYGVVYALTALSCSLPVFLMILFNARWSPIIYLIYSLGFTLPALVVGAITSISYQLARKIYRFSAKYIEVISGVLLILAGIYLLFL